MNANITNSALRSKNLFKRRFLFSRKPVENSSLHGTEVSPNVGYQDDTSYDLTRSIQQSNLASSRRLSSTGSSIISVGRQTLQSLRMRRIHLMMNKQTLPEFETEAYCQHCEKYLQTRVRYRNGSMVWLMSFILLMCTVFLFWVPFYVKYFKDVSHYCPGCGKKLGTYHRI